MKQQTENFDAQQNIGSAIDIEFTEQLGTAIAYLYGVAYKLTTDVSDAEDLVQQALLKGWERRSQLNEISALKYWLRSIMINLFYEKHRLTHISEVSLTALQEDTFTLPEITDNAPSVIDTMIADEHIRSVRDGCFLAMARKLTLEQRITFSLVEMFGLQINEISTILSISPGAAKALLHRARSNIDRFFSERCGHLDPAKPCRCSQWFDFAGRREQNRLELSDRRIITSFPETPDTFSAPHELRAAISSIYRTIPERRPNDEWYETVIKSIKKFSHPVS